LFSTIWFHFFSCAFHSQPLPVTPVSLNLSHSSTFLLYVEVVCFPQNQVPGLHKLLLMVCLWHWPKTLEGVASYRGRKKLAKTSNKSLDFGSYWKVHLSSFLCHCGRAERQQLHRIWWQERLVTCALHLEEVTCKDLTLVTVLCQATTALTVLSLIGTVI
jgi:hypothetical protein